MKGGMVCFGYRRVPEEEKERLVLEHFNRVAARYDRMNSLLSFGMHHVWRRAAVRMLAPAPGERVLDVCGGTADLSILIARAVGPAGLVALYDINSAMMRFGRLKIERLNLGGALRYVRGNAERLSVRGGFFDAVTVAFGVRNLTHVEKGFEEMFRVLRPGGRLLCLELSRPTAAPFRWLYDRYSAHVMPLAGKILAGSRESYTYLPQSVRVFPMPGELSRMLEGIGFRDVSYRRMTNGIAVAHLGRKP